MHAYSSDQLLQNHIPHCDIKDVQKTLLPSKYEDILEFTNFSNNSFINYFDFETFPEPISSTTPSFSTPFANHIQKHEPCCFAYIVVSVDQRYYRKPVLYRGPNAVENFLEHMKKEALWIEHILDRIEPVQFTNNDYRNLLNQTDCHICGASLNEKSKYLDHCHVTGRVRGYACYCITWLLHNVVIAYMQFTV